MAANSEFQMIQEKGWRRGLSNLMNAEFRRWWQTNQWWIQVVIWVLVLDGLLAMMLWSPANAGMDEAIMLFSIFAGLFAPVATVIIMQDTIVGEKQSGTAAWILSKPVSRPAFILSKLFPNMLGLLINILLIPSILVFVQLRLAFGDAIQPVSFLAGLAGLAVNLIFYQAMTLMLGTFFNHRGPVIGIPLAFLFMQQYLVGLFKPLESILPWGIIAPIGQDQTSAIVPTLILGQQPSTLLPIFAAIGFVILFAVIAVWRFQREEF